jgi:hypothetical protein
MKGLTRELIVLWFGVIAAYLVLEHYTGFSKDVGSIATGATGFSRVLQGR